MSVPPEVMIQLAQAMSSAGKSSAPAQGAPGPSPFSAFTPEQAQQAFEYAQQQGRNMEGVYGAGSNIAGVNTNQTSQVKPQEVKAAQYVKYLVSTGLSPEAAQQKAQKVISNPNIKFADDAGFKKWINQGNASGLSMSNGSIKADPVYNAGGVNVSPESQALNQAFQQFNQQGLSAANGLPQMIGMDTARSIAQKQQLAGLAGNMLGQGFTETGLTPSEQAQMEAIQNGYYQQYGDLFNKTMQQATGELQNSGFTSSNLASKSLQDGAYNAQSRFLTEALSGLAGKEQDLINQRFNRQTGNLNNVLNAYGTLGANTGIQGVTAGIINPNQAGLFNDVSAGQLGAQIQQSNVGNRQAQNSMETGILTTPTTIVPKAPGFWGNFASQVAPIFGGSIAGAALGAAGQTAGSGYRNA